MLDTIISLATQNFLNPVILFFILGFAAKLFQSDLAIPGNVSKFIAIYLMMAIGYKGGYALSQHEIGPEVLITIIAGMAISFTLPVIAFFMLGGLGLKAVEDRAVIAAHYGSVSIVTFVTASEFLKSLSIPSDSWMVAVLAAMETPAIFMSFLLINFMSKTKESHVKFDSHVWREIFLNGAVVLLIGSFAIGFIAGEPGMEAVKPFFGDLFKGVLCLFMVDIGLLAASRIRASESNLTPFIMFFGVAMPVVASMIGVMSGAMIGLSLGNLMLFTVLCASASYIAVPAAFRIAMPNFNLSPAIALSLAVTFPFNILFGIPLYLMLAKFFSGQ
jgi:hypothetical protein